VGVYARLAHILNIEGINLLRFNAGL